MLDQFEWSSASVYADRLRNPKARLREYEKGMVSNLLAHYADLLRALEDAHAAEAAGRWGDRRKALDRALDLTRVEVHDSLGENHA